MNTINLNLKFNSTPSPEKVDPDSIGIETSIEMPIRFPEALKEYVIPYETKQRLALIIPAKCDGVIDIKISIPTKEQAIKELQDQWREENYEPGIMFGYPECCVNQFCLDHPMLLDWLPKTDERIQKDKLRFDVSWLNDGKDYTGFFPCDDCAQKIKEGHITLESLIDTTKRHPAFGVFPNFKNNSVVPVPWKNQF